MKKLFAAMIGAGFVLGAAPAFAGEWQLDARRCADLREDWRDARVDYGRADRREDRRDRAVTVCPRSAFVYVSDRHDNRRDNWRDNRRGYGNDHGYDRRGRDAYGKDARGHDNGYASNHRRGNNNSRYDRRDSFRAPPMKLRYDRRMRMQYTYDHGRKIYVRG